ncbi:uncharacterized protein WCC33_011617 [Rhinophrynus dorsalis]
MLCRRERPWSPNLRAWALTVFLTLWINLAFGVDIILIPPHPVVNQSVILNVNGINEAIRSFSWHQGMEPSSSNQILFCIPNPNCTQADVDPQFPEASGLPNGSLLIKNLSKRFEGFYTVRIQTNSPQQQGTVNLIIHDVLLTPPPPPTNDEWIIPVAVIVTILVVCGILVAGYIVYKKKIKGREKPGLSLPYPPPMSLSPPLSNQPPSMSLYAAFSGSPGLHSGYLSTTQKLEGFGIREQICDSVTTNGKCSS